MSTLVPEVCGGFEPPLSGWWSAHKCMFSWFPSLPCVTLPLSCKTVPPDHRSFLWSPPILHSCFIDNFQGKPNAHQPVTETLVLPHVSFRASACRAGTFPMQFKSWLRMWTRSPQNPLLFQDPRFQLTEAGWRAMVKTSDFRAKVPGFKFWLWLASCMTLGMLLTFLSPSFLVCKTSLLVVLVLEVAMRIKWVHICKALCPVPGPKQVL